MLNTEYPIEKLEIIVVDDGSTDDTKAHLVFFKTIFPQVKVISFEENRGRLAARNAGMAQATKDWICWLDSDDEYSTNYFSVLDYAINKFEEYRIFNFGAIVYDEEGFRSYLRDTFLPGVRPDRTGHDVFKSGGIGTGSFVFHRTLLESVGSLPEARTPYGDDRSLPALAAAQWPEIKDLYGRTDSGQWKPFGNPWGDDWLMFYLLTRNNLSKPLDIHLYVQHLRK